MANQLASIISDAEFNLSHQGLSFEIWKIAIGNSMKKLNKVLHKMA